MPVAAALLALWGATTGPAVPHRSERAAPLPFAPVRPDSLRRPPATSPTEAASPDANDDSPTDIKVVLTPARSQVVLGSTAEVSVTLAVAGPRAETFRPVRAFATVGELELPTPGDRPGAFQTRYHPPANRFPQVALLVVELASGPRRLLASARISLEGATVVPFRTNPGAAVTLRVAKRVFGPVVADREGRAEVPVEVPPGARTGLARAVDQNAAARETEVDLQLPAFPRIAVVAPPRLEAGSFAEVAVFAVEPDGTPCPASSLDIIASDALVHGMGAGPAGEARFLLEAPRIIRSGPLALTATAAGSPPAQADVRLRLEPARPAQLAVILSPRRLVIGTAETATVAVVVRDTFGNLTSSAGAEVQIDGEARPLAIDATGVGVVTIPAPARPAGRDHFEVQAALGNLFALDRIHITGGSPARLTLSIRDGRIIGDGQRSTELHVQAVDANGIATRVPGLSWDTPDGRIRRVRVPHDGEYVAEYVPDRARERHQETVAVMAARGLRAEGKVEVLPSPVRLAAAVRAGIYTNLGHLTGAAVFLEALRPFEIRRVRFQAGITSGYLHGDLDAPGLQTVGTPTLDVDEVAVLALARGRIALPMRLEGTADVGAGYAWAGTRIHTSLHPPIGWASAPALGAGAELGLPLKPGRLLIGLRFLWIELGKTSQGDVIAGNSAGLMGDIGYKLTF